MDEREVASAWKVGSSEGAGSSWTVRFWNPSADVPEPFQLCLSRLQVTGQPQTASKDRSQDNHLHLPQSIGGGRRGQLSRTALILGSPLWNPLPSSASSLLRRDEMSFTCSDDDRLGRCLLDSAGSPAFMEEAAMWEGPMWPGTEGSLQPSTSKESSQPPPEGLEADPSPAGPRDQCSPFPQLRP